ncbi:hypothetical protein Gpo141_00000224 [Globisporangium polare]
MEMDFFANLTALSPPEDRSGSAVSVKRSMAKTAVVLSSTSESMRRSGEGIRRGKLADDHNDDDNGNGGDRSMDTSIMDESVSNMQCSADPSALPGLQSRINAHGAAGKRDERDPSKQMRLALDLSSSRKHYDFRPEGVSISQLSQNTSYSQQHFAELFYGDTQDDYQETTERKSPPAATASPAALTVATDAEPRVFVTRGGEHKGVQRSPPAAILFSVDRDMNKRKQAVVPSSCKPTGAVWHESTETSDGEDTAYTPQFASGVPTPPLAAAVDDDDEEDNARPFFITSFTRSSSDESRSTSPVNRQFEMENAEMEPMFSNIVGDDGEQEHEYEHGRRDSIDSFPDTQSLGDIEMEDDDEVGNGVEMELEKSSTAGALKEAKQVADNPAQEDDGVEMPTQPSTSANTPVKSISPVQHASPGRIALKKREKVAPHVLSTLTDSVQKSSNQKLSLASRNLAFSFAMPDSQESESQAADSTPDVAMMASNGLDAISDSGKLAAEAAAMKAQTTAAATTATRKNEIPRTPVSLAVKKAKKSASDTASTGTSSVESTPTHRKRKRAFVSPDAGMKDPPTPSTASKDATPVRSSRIAARSSTGSSEPPGKSSTPIMRTRAKLLSPLPSNRAYASRTKTIFKYKFEFCLTGFLNEGEASLIKMIEDHGGKIAERPEDVIHKGNPKAVVIAMPVSWRKLKFIHAIACGIPVVHSEWISACAKAGQVVPFDGYHIPSGLSITTRKFECLPVQQLDIFAELSFGIPYDVVQMSKSSAKGAGLLFAFVLKALGAKRVIEDLEPSREKLVDIVLSDELTKTCESYRKRHKIPVANFAWVTECMILQRFVSPKGEDFQPQAHADDDDDDDETPREVRSATAEIGDSDRNKLKLHAGELVLVDRLGNEFDHFLLFHVCEILRITITREVNKHGDITDEEQVMLEVGVLKRYPNSPGLSRVHSKILTISASQVKGRVVAVSKEDFQALRYRDESIFYYEEEEGGKGDNDEDDPDDDGDNDE